MRIRAMVALGAVVLALVLGFIGEAARQDWIFVLSGLFWVAAIVLGVSLLRFWRLALPQVPRMPGLFRRPGQGERWCGACGSPAPAGQACAVCGAAAKPRSRPRRAKAAS